MKKTTKKKKKIAGSAGGSVGTADSRSSAGGSVGTADSLIALMHAAPLFVFSLSRLPQLYRLWA